MNHLYTVRALGSGTPPQRVRRLARALLLFALLAGLGCAFGEIRPEDPFQRKYSLEGAQKRYTDLVRWSKFDEAAAVSFYAAPYAMLSTRAALPASQ